MRIFLAAALALATGAAHAQLTQCAAIEADAARLACYDKLAGRSAPAQPAPTPVGTADAGLDPAAGSELERRWQLGAAPAGGVFELKPYRPVYALVRATNRPNERPQSPTRPFNPLDQINFDNAEVKLQLSFKTKVVQDVFGTRGDLWFGYTQQSYWQAGNRRYSSLFRESNYEPEAIYIQPVAASFGDLRIPYVGFMLNHQSNGQSRPYSRSWNRLIADLPLEYRDWTFHVRPWTRVFESGGERNDNPDIEDYVGRGEVKLERRIGAHVLSASLRHTLRGGSRSRGSAQADWAFPLVGGIKGHLQLFTGYGESLVDYNYKQTSFGVGVSFFD